MNGSGTIFFRADHDLVGRVLAEKLKQRATPLPEPTEPLFAECYQLEDEDAEREAKVSEWGEIVLAIDRFGEVFGVMVAVFLAAAAIVAIATGGR